MSMAFTEVKFQVGKCLFSLTLFDVIELPVWNLILKKLLTFCF